jgi:uncharacterized protein (TIGR02118 family)
MIRVSVSYPNQPGARFDVDYYLNHHMPMVEKKLAPHGLTSWTVDKGLSGGAPGSSPDLLIQGRFDIESIEGLQAGLAAEGASIMADIPNYTDIRPQIQVYQVLR